MNQVAKRRWRRVDGVLLLDKPTGISSNDALQKARRLFSAEKAGHTGTLDPMATGLLPLCFGEATKFSADLLNADKTYEATLKLGICTDTGDAEGRVTSESLVNADEDQLRQVLPSFTGPIRQVPPMYSALKRDGKPLYELARQGIEVEREARDVVIHRLELLGFSGETVSLRVRCSKGTYIRTLAEDIGKALGCGAHLIALRRTQVGDLVLPRALTLSEIESCEESKRDALLQPVDSLLQNLPSVAIDGAAAARFGHGNPVMPGAPVAGLCRVYADGQLLGLGLGDEAGLLHPKRLVAQAAP
jgi:tRNA pseudouridine55 synthase